MHAQHGDPRQKHPLTPAQVELRGISLVRLGKRHDLVSVSLSGRALAIEPWSFHPTELAFRKSRTLLFDLLKKL
jgi:hypothetical protein